MISSFLITLREGLEAALIVAILLTYLGKTGRREEGRFVWWGTLSATGACLIVGTLLYVLVDGLNGKVEYAVEGSIALAATVVLTHMIFWMRRNSQSLSAELRHKVDTAAKASLFAIAFVAVMREGLETVLFLLSAETSSSSGSSVVVGGLIGLVAAMVIGVLVFAGGRKVNLKAFFNVTAVLLLLFAAGLAGKAVHEFIELAGAEDVWFAQPVWTIEGGMWASGTFYDFMRGLFGWSKSPELLTLVAYFGYLLPVMYIYFRKGDRTAKTLNSTAVGATA